MCSRRTAAVFLTALALLAAGCSTDTDAPSAAAPPPEPRNAKELFEGCVSPWDGNHDGLEDLIRPLLNDPGSMETHGTYYSSDDSLADGKISIRLDYSAANMLGGKVRANAIAEMGLDCEIIAVVDYGF